MCDRRWAAAAVLLLVSLTGRLSAQESTPWHDPSPHKIQFVTVDKDVKLEVLDWAAQGGLWFCWRALEPLLTRMMTSRRNSLPSTTFTESQDAASVLLVLLTPGTRPIDSATMCLRF